MVSFRPDSFAHRIRLALAASLGDGYHFVNRSDCEQLVECASIGVSLGRLTDGDRNFVAASDTNPEDHADSHLNSVAATIRHRLGVSFCKPFSRRHQIGRHIVTERNFRRDLHGIVRREHKYVLRVDVASGNGHHVRIADSFLCVGHGVSCRVGEPFAVPVTPNSDRL
jgi:hypothetical protein